MKQLKKIKKILKNNNKYKKYKKKFSNKQMRFVYSKIYLSFNSNADLEKLAIHEMSLIDRKEDINLYKEVCKNIEKIAFDFSSWNDFYKILWISFNESKYSRDKKTNRYNIFLNDSVIDIYAERRAYYTKWILSIDKSRPNFNTKVKKIIKLIF